MISDEIVGGLIVLVCGAIIIAAIRAPIVIENLRRIGREAKSERGRKVKWEEVQLARIRACLHDADTTQDRAGSALCVSRAIAIADEKYPSTVEDAPLPLRPIELSPAQPPEYRPPHGGLVLVEMRFANGRYQRLTGEAAQVWVDKCNASLAVQQLRGGFCLPPDPWEVVTEGS